MKREIQININILISGTTILRYIRSVLIIHFILTNNCWMYTWSQDVWTLSCVKYKIAKFSSTKGITSELIYVDSTRNLNIIGGIQRGSSSISTRTCSIQNTMLNKRINILTYFHWKELNQNVMTIVFHFMNCSSGFYIHVQRSIDLVQGQLQGQKLPCHFALRKVYIQCCTFLHVKRKRKH